MSARSRVALIWAVLGTGIAAVAIALWSPMHVAWSCYWLHANGERGEAELVKKLEGETLVLRITSGSRRGDACTANTSPSHFESAQPGEVFEVVYLEDRPGDCELAATVESSGLLLWSMSGVLFFGLLLVVGLGLFVQRSFTVPRGPRRRMQVEPGSVLCPVCSNAMAEGYTPLLSGLHWRELGEPIGMPHALRGMAGTVGMRERPRLHAFRCERCEILTLQYGTPHDSGSSAPIA